MVTESLIIRLKELRSLLANLVAGDANAQMSNPRYMSDGTQAKMNADIDGTRARMKQLYADHTLVVQAGDERQLNIVSEDGGATFNIRALDLSRPGVFKSVNFKLDRDNVALLVDYLGGRQVLFQGQHVDSLAAVKALEVENKRLENAVRSETLRAVEFERKYNLLDASMPSHFADAE